MLVSTKLTYDDLKYTPDDGKRYELIDGELYVSAAPMTPHQRTVWYCAIRWLGPAEDAGFGRGFVAPMDVVFDQSNVVEPDLLFVRTERLQIIEEANIQGAPDLLVEVLSPSTSKRDVGVKMQLYARFHVPCYFVFDPKERTVQPYELVGSEYRQLPLLGQGDELTCGLFPGLSVRVAKLFD